MNERKIEVEGFFGPKQVTEDEFTQIWVDHARELHRLGSNAKHLEYFTSVVNKVRSIAHNEFNRIWEQDNA